MSELVIPTRPAFAPATARLDHLVIGAPDLAGGMARFRALTGVEPTPGGRHPDFGTENALVSLGPGLYLEIIAPVAGKEPRASFADLSQLKHLEDLTPIAWAVAVADATRLAADLRGCGIAVNGPFAGSRLTPDGGRLEWSLVTLAEERPGWPFFLAWSAGAPHPSSTAAGGGSLVSLTLESPRAESLRADLARFALPVAIAGAAQPGLRATLESPRGRIELRGR
jgi:glyoxalase-like protein